MRVNVDYTVAVEFANFLSRDDYMEQEVRERFSESLKSNKSFQKQFQFHEGNMTSEEYFEAIFSILDGKAVETENFVVSFISNSFKHILGKKEILLKKIKNLQEYDFKALEKRLSETLPENTPLDINIHLVLDGFNAGSIVDESNMLIDSIFWPSEKGNEPMMEGIILHEYHHLGIKYWMDNNRGLNGVKKEKNGGSICAELVGGVLGEGAATYLFNQNEDLVKLLAEGYGEELAEQYAESLKVAELSMEDLMKKFENDIEHLLNNNDDEYSVMRLIANEYSFSEEYGQPLDKSIGVYMCKSTEKTFGLEGLVELFKDMSLFFEKYNEAAEKIDAYKIKNEVVQGWSKLWNNAE